MAIINRTSVSIRLSGEDLDPDELTSLLGVQPTHSYRKGTRTLPKGRQVPAKCGLWCLESERASPGDLSRQIRDLLGQMTDDLSVWDLLTKRFKVDAFCGLWLDETNEGETLEADVLLMLSQRGIKLELDIYSGRVDDDQ